MKELDINKEYNNGGSLYLEDGYLYKVYNEISYFREEKERNIKFLMNNSIPNTPKIYKMLYRKPSYTIILYGLRKTPLCGIWQYNEKVVEY